MACVTTSPLKIEQYESIMNHFISAEDWNYAGIVIFMGKLLRIRDVLETINVTDVYLEDGTIRESIRINEMKTGKLRIIPTSGKLIHLVLENIWKSLKANKREYSNTTNLFYSRKATGKNRNTPINTVTVNRNLKSVVEVLGLGNVIEQISSHSLRKTGAKNLLNQGVPMEVIGDMFNHSDNRITRRYLGINSEDISKAYAMMEY